MDTSDRKRLDDAVGELVRGLGARLHAVTLRGEAAGSAYRPRESRLDLVVVVDSVDGALLRTLRPSASGWRRRRIPPPLVLDPAYIESALDTFPLEFLDLSDRRSHLFGTVDPFVDLTINAEHLRLEVEEQLRGKLLHLWDAYVRFGRSARRLRSLLLAASLAYDPLLRAMLYLRDHPRPDDEMECIRRVEQTFELRLPTLVLLAGARRGVENLDRATLDDAFDGCLFEARTLVGTVDRL